MKDFLRYSTLCSLPLLVGLLYSLHSCLCDAAVLSQARYSLAATSVGDVALFAGGNTGSAPSPQVDIYNATTGNWSIAMLSVARYDFAATTVDNLALFGGGHGEDGPSLTVDLYNVSSNAWTTAPLSQARSVLAATNVGVLAMFAGGWTGTEPSAQVDIFNLTSSRWTTSSLSVARHDLAATSVSDLALFAGGYNQNMNTFYDQVDIFNASSGVWFNAALTQARFDLASATVGDVTLFAGGYVGSGDYSANVDFYNASSRTWSTGFLSQARAALAASTVGEWVVFALGGLAINCATTSVAVDVFSLNLNAWSRASLSEGRCLLAATSVGNISFFAGGYNGSAASAQVDVYNNSCEAGAVYAAFGACSQCASGSFSAASAVSCSSCPAGSYADEPGTANNCTLCAAGTASATVGATSASACSSCGVGTYAPAGSQGCLACPEGMTSDQGSASCHTDTQRTSAALSQGDIIAVTVVPALCLLAGLVVFYLWWRRQHTRTAEIKMVETGDWTQVQNVEIGDRLGGGQFGEVFRGSWNGATPVALKKLKSTENLREFAREASVLQSVNHPHVVRFLGIYTAPSRDHQYIVMEFLAKGSLDALLAREKDSIQPVDLLSMAKQAAAGMSYLEERKIVHRDLALRNLLVASGEGNDLYLVKVSDFGLSRPMQQGYYRNTSADQQIPVRWCSPEVFQQGVSTSKSDVWSFGIVLWEIFSYGRMPYSGFPVGDVVTQVLSGYQMPSPDNCPVEVYSLMVKCWAFNPNGRPSFAELATQLVRLHKDWLSRNQTLSWGQPSSSSQYVSEASSSSCWASTHQNSVYSNTTNV